MLNSANLGSGVFFFKFLFYMILFYSFFLFGLEMTILEMIMLRECWGKVEKMIQNRFRWFEFVERRVDLVRRIGPIERSEEEDLENLLREVIKKDLEIKDLDRSMILDRTL